MTTRQHRGPRIDRSIRIDVAPELVYEAWADPQKIAQWFVDSAEGRAEEGHVVQWRFESMDFTLPVPVVASQPPHLLAFGGELPGRPPFLQTVEIKQQGGSSLLRMINSGFAERDENFAGVDSGWAMALATLKHWLENVAPGDRRHHELVMSQAPLPSLAAAAPLFSTRAGLGSWLGEGVELEPEPEPERIRAELGGLPLNGSVLCRTAWELLLAWPEAHGTLGLKAFTQGPGANFVALDFNSWQPAARALPTDLRPALEAACQRLAQAAGA